VKQFVFLLLAAAVIATGCSNDEEIPDTGFIITGNNRTATIHPEEKVLTGGYYQPVALDLDVNSDGINDYRLKSEVWGSPGMGQHPAASILSLHGNALLSGRISTDTIWLTKTVNYSQEPGQPVVVSTVLSHNCLKETQWSVADNILHNKFRLSYFTEGATLATTDQYQPDTACLTDDWMRINSYSQVNDTIWNSLSTTSYSCWSMPDDEIRYIGFSLKADNRQRLGWIKLKVKNNLEVFCAEWAIQP